MVEGGWGKVQSKEKILGWQERGYVEINIKMALASSLYQSICPSIYGMYVPPSFYLSMYLSQPSSESTRWIPSE